MMLEDPYVEAALQAPPSLDYVPGPEYPPSPVYVPYVSESIYPEFMPPEEYVLPAEEQPLPASVLPTPDSPGYITESNPEEDLEEDDEDPKEDPADYPDDKDDGEEEEEESSGHNVDNVEKDEDEDEEEEEHLALADSVPPPIHRVTAWMSIQAQTPISLPSDTEVARLLAIPTPPPSPLSPLSSPLPQILSPLPHILSPPLPVSPPPLPASPTYPLGYRAAMIRLRAKSPSTSHHNMSSQYHNIINTKFFARLSEGIGICFASVFSILTPCVVMMPIDHALRFRLGGVRQIGIQSQGYKELGGLA
ncbi:hypothetical protein Tco_1120181 [Tanacetum coccineum]